MHHVRDATTTVIFLVTFAWTCLASPLLAGSTLIQLPGTAGCISDSGTAGACVDGKALDNARAVTVSPDGKNVYVAAVTAGAVNVFDRNPVTGVLTQKAGIAGCVSDTGTAGECADGVALGGADGVVVSPDGRNVYVTATSGALAIFDRDLATGVLTQKAGTSGCISETGSAGSCVDGKALLTSFGPAISPDGRNVYAGAVASDAVTVFDRNTATGALTQKAGTAGCISEDGTVGLCADGIALNGAAVVAVAPDGRNVYVASEISGSVSVFDRDTTTGALTQKAGVAGCVSDDGTAAQCANGDALVGAFFVVVSPDGRNVYVASDQSDAVAVFDRNTATGELTQKVGGLGCIIDVHTSDPCTDGLALDFPLTVALNPEGDTVYVAASQTADAVTVFDRDPGAGALTLEKTPAGCVSDLGTGGVCVDGRAMDGVNWVAVSGDGRNVYGTSSTSDAVVVFARATLPYDVDGDGLTNALTDGLLLLRYEFGFRGATLISGVVGLAGCTRCTAELIEAFIQGLLD